MIILALLLSLVLLVITTLHVYWGIGGIWPGRDAKSCAHTVVGFHGVDEMPSSFASFAVAAPEEVYDIRARDAVHLTELAWHIGNRHLAAAIEAHRILILRDHVIKAMLEGLGATVSEVSQPFSPVRGAYSGHGHDHSHDHHGHDHHDHDHAHGHHHDRGHHHHDHD